MASNSALRSSVSETAVDQILEKVKQYEAQKAELAQESLKLSRRREVTVVDVPSSSDEEKDDLMSHSEREDDVLSTGLSEDKDDLLSEDVLSVVLTDDQDDFVSDALSDDKDELKEKDSRHDSLPQDENEGAIGPLPPLPKMNGQTGIKKIAYTQEKLETL